MTKQRGRARNGPAFFFDVLRFVTLLDRCIGECCPIFTHFTLSHLLAKANSPFISP
jgi:hypothetical protein